MSLWYVFPILHAAACLALAAAAVYRKLRYPVPEGVHRNLFPFIIAAGLAGCLLIFPPAIEMFIAWQRASLYEEVGFRFGGPYRWFYLSAVLLPLLPIAGILRPVGKRPMLMAVLACLAMLPAIYFLIMFR